ncbi:MAG: endopeptidase La [Bacteroidetes bacterium]|nr:endopeptidase La [Bacteroidota bacterium]
MQKYTDASALHLLPGEGSFESDFQELLEGDDKHLNAEDIPQELPILPLRNTVLFPGVVIPITVARDKSIQLVRAANKLEAKQIGVITQRNSETEDPTPDDLYDTGTLANILRLIRMPDGSVTIIIQGRTRFQVDEYTQTDPYFRARIHRYDEVFPPEKVSRALIISLKREATRAIELSPNVPSEAVGTIQNINSLAFLVHFTASHLNLPIPDKQKILAIPRLEEKAQYVLENLTNEVQVLELTEEIQSKVRGDMDKQQRDYILRQQLKAIQDELGEYSAEQELDSFRQRADAKKWPKHAREAFDKEMARLNRSQPGSPDYSVAINYIDWLLDLPWNETTKDTFSQKKAQKVLNAHHYGLEKVKDRILEHLAVLQLKPDRKAGILCLYGPPGVGKTSLGKSIAEALGRKFVRMSLGGVRDEAEIRGHRRTYIGALPGRILQGLKKAGSNNPVFILDEVDKMGHDFRGDPANALLEVLDPEQNNTFNDHYLELDYDLSQVLFIATANSLDTLHPALRDRMEIIEINGYTLPEKVQIAKQHLIPASRKDHGLTEEQFALDPRTTQFLAEGYTRESGVRQLNQKVNALARKVARKVVEASLEPGKLTPERVEILLGPPRFEHDQWQKVEVPGVSIGLAWTPVGGEILYIESALSRGTGKLSLSGQLGEVMKESAHLAYIYLRAHADTYKIHPDAFRYWDLHIHIPAGAVPKDGPSAGIALLTAIASALTQRPMQDKLAMTGEITLRGKVLPVGGIPEKLLAAARAGIQDVILCKENRKDVLEIKPDHLKGLTLHYVERMDEVLALALQTKPVRNALTLEIPAGEKPAVGQSSSVVVSAV